jgi:hypothetical protein
MALILQLYCLISFEYRSQIRGRVAWLFYHASSFILDRILRSHNTIMPLSFQEGEGDMHDRLCKEMLKRWVREMEISAALYRCWLVIGFHHRRLYVC